MHTCRSPRRGPWFRHPEKATARHLPRLPLHWALAAVWPGDSACIERRRRTSNAVRDVRHIDLPSLTPPESAPAFPIHRGLPEPFGTVGSGHVAAQTAIGVPRALEEKDAEAPSAVQIGRVSLGSLSHRVQLSSNFFVSRWKRVLDTSAQESQAPPLSSSRFGHWLGRHSRDTRSRRDTR